MSESPSGAGEAPVYTADGDKSVVCPTCKRDDFKSNRGMRMHHARSHGASLSKTQIDCSYCGVKMRRLKCFVSDRNFCSMDCQHKWQSENQRGENHHQYNRVTVNCETCGTEVKKKPSRLETYDNAFCSMECHREYQSIHQVGENHHNYEGGRAKEYGPNWHRQRRERIEYDDEECQRCGASRSSKGRDLHVHHITPRKEFMDDSGGFDYKLANRLENLITLCDSCHKTVESWGLNPISR